MVQKIGEFPLHVQFVKDTYVVAKLLMAGDETAYGYVYVAIIYWNKLER